MEVSASRPQIAPLALPQHHPTSAPAAVHAHKEVELAAANTRTHGQPVGTCSWESQSAPPDLPPGRNVCRGRVCRWLWGVSRRARCVVRVCVCVCMCGFPKQCSRTYLYLHSGVYFNVHASMSVGTSPRQARQMWGWFMVKIRHFCFLFWNTQVSLCYGANWHPPSLLHRQNIMSNTSHGPWRYWCYYTCLFWDLHKQIRRFPQILRKLKSLSGNSKNMRTSRIRWFYCTNSINHKVVYLKMLEQIYFWIYRCYLKWYQMLLHASADYA